jgi:hypothetical protein
MEGEYIQIGVISARAPDGSFLPSVPIYTKRTPDAERAEEAALRPVARIFAEKMETYLRETKKTSRRSGSEKERSI